MGNHDDLLVPEPPLADHTVQFGIKLLFLFRHFAFLNACLDNAVGIYEYDADCALIQFNIFRTITSVFRQEYISGVGDIRIYFSGSPR